MEETPERKHLLQFRGQEHLPGKGVAQDGIQGHGNRAPDDAPPRHGQEQVHIEPQQVFGEAAVEKARQEAVGCQLKGHGRGRGEHGGHPEHHAPQQGGNGPHNEAHPAAGAGYLFVFRLLHDAQHPV